MREKGKTMKYVVFFVAAMICFLNDTCGAAFVGTLCNFVASTVMSVTLLIIATDWICKFQSRMETA